MTSIRPLALAAVRRGDDLLVFEGRDESKAETFYRPLGGGIEFGERAEEALRREFREELAAELTNISLLGVLENLFTAYGRSGHEIVFLYAADLLDRSLYERDNVGHILDGGSPVTWQPLHRFTGDAGLAPLYPHGLTDLLQPATTR